MHKNTHIILIYFLKIFFLTKLDTSQCNYFTDWNEKAANVALRAMNIWNAGNVTLLGGISKETPNLPLKAATGFVNLIRISDTPLLDNILLLTPHDSMWTSHFLVYDFSNFNFNIAKSFLLSLEITPFENSWKCIFFEHALSSLCLLLVSAKRTSDDSASLPGKLRP